MRNIIVEEENVQITDIHEMIVNTYDSLPTEVENSVFYPKLKQLLHLEIVRFCREQIELKNDLNEFRRLVGEALTENEIRDFLESLKEKYNNINSNVGILYHIESTRVDFGVSVTIVIKRNDIHMKNFIFRFRKKNFAVGLNGLANSGLFEIGGGDEE